MTTKHTPGPWNVYLAQPYDEHCFEVSYDTKDGLTYPIADIHEVEDGDPEANAQLIAAAPELLEALSCAEKVLWYVVEEMGEEQFKVELDLAQQAIVKAEGKE
jgi:hypothetical protein